MTVAPIAAASLRRPCDPGAFPFETTASLEPLAARIGQERAVEAVRFGVAVRHEGYNLFAMGPAEAGKYTAVRSLLDERAAKEPVPKDVCYVNNFASPHEPRVLLLPSGTGRRLRRDLEQLVEELRTVIPRAIEGEELRSKKQQIEEEAKARHNREITSLRDRAAQKNIALVQAPMGFGLAPTKGGDVIDPEVFARLPDEERERFKEDVEAFSRELAALIEQAPRWEQEVRKKIKELVRETVVAAVAHLLDDLKKKHEGEADVLAYLGALAQDVLDNATDFLRPEEAPSPIALPELEGASPFRRYQVNLLVDHAETKGAPIVYEDHPVYDKLLGRVEHLARLGALVTDYTLIKPGVLHKANGGYLILDGRNLVLQAYAYEALKRALLSKQIRIESLGQMLSLQSTVSLEPEPVPLDVKVILLGDRRLFYLLSQLDPEFPALFKVAVDFEDEVDRTADNDLAYARLVATIAGENGLSHFDRTGVARVIERCARLAEDAEKLSTHMGTIIDLLRESDHFCRARGGAVVGAEDVDRAVSAAERREGRVRERMLEEIERGTMLLTTSGAKVGQVNGLSVIQLGRASFGRPSRITARVRLGRGEVLDIEREVELGGPLHSKGVMILAGFLGARYAEDRPLSLQASLAFEQSYGMVEGDSASSAELYALLSALSRVPIKQSIAVTGSVNQHGEVQAIGGVNEKIEGFFDVCRARGLDGTQGVLIPASNVKHLMLKDEVVEAAREGKFSVWAVQSVDQGMEVLTGVPAGERDAEGCFPEGTVNARVEARLVALAKLRMATAETGKGEAGEPKHEGAG